MPHLEELKDPTRYVGTHIHSAHSRELPPEVHRLVRSVGVWRSQFGPLLDGISPPTRAVIAAYDAYRGA